MRVSSTGPLLRSKSWSAPLSATFFISIFILAACGSIALAQSGGKRDTLTAAFGAESTTLDPQKAAAGVDYYMISQMFEQLVRQDPNRKTVNWLAESYKVNEVDGHIAIDVTLRPGVKFHNGDPLTSEDFEFSFNRARDPKVSRLPHLQASISKFEIINDLQFRLHFSEGDATYISDNLRLWAIPKKYFLSVGEEQFAQKPVGTGPWRFVSRSIKEQIKFEAFPEYWNREHRPSVKNLIIKIIPEDLTRVAALKTGSVDLIDAAPLALVAELKSNPDIRTASLNTGNNLYMQLGTHVPNSPFNDVRVRKAAAHAMDMDAIVKSVLFGQAVRYTQLGEGEAGYDPALKPYAYDPKKARELLAEAGYPRGFDTACYNLTTPREPNIKEYGEAVFAYFAAVGIRCRVIGLEYSAWLTTKRRWPADSPVKSMEGIISDMYGHGGLPGDPGTAWQATLHSFEPGTGFGVSSYSNDKEVDALIQQQRREMNREKRLEILKKIALLKNERVLGGITTYRPLSTFAWRSNVKFTPWASPAYWHQLQEVGFD